MKTLQMLSILVMLGACGSSSSTLGPLRHTFDERNIAGVPLSERDAIVSAETEVTRAQMRIDNVEAELRDARLELDVAKNRMQQAKLETSACKKRMEAAEKCYKRAKIETAEYGLEQAQRAEAAAAARVDYELAVVAAKEQQLRVAKALWYAAMARRELAEAQLATAQGIDAPGPSIAELDEQVNQRREIVARERDQLRAARQDALALEAEWTRLDQVAIGGQPAPN